MAVLKEESLQCYSTNEKEILKSSHAVKKKLINCTNVHVYTSRGVKHMNQILPTLRTQHMGSIAESNLQHPVQGR